MSLRRTVQHEDSTSELSQIVLPSISHISKHQVGPLYLQLSEDTMKGRLYPKRSLLNKIADSKLAIHFAESKEVQPDIAGIKHE